MQSVDFPNTVLYISMWTIVRTDQIWTPPPRSSLSLPLHAPSFGPLHHSLAYVVGSLPAFRRIKSLGLRAAQLSAWATSLHMTLGSA